MKCKKEEEEEDIQEICTNESIVNQIHFHPKCKHKESARDGKRPGVLSLKQWIR